MCDKTELARQMMTEGAYTCVLLLGDAQYTSRERGVKPLLMLLQSGRSYEGAVAADKTVGAGAAHLYVLLGVRRLWANVISTAALQVLAQNGIEAAYGECVPYIINRRGDGPCPIESAVEGAKNSREAHERILCALERLQQK